jgi:hypothetical protein
VSVQSWGVRFICDCCEATGDSPAPPREGQFIWSDMPRPAGWLTLAPDLNIRLEDVFGCQVQHLCTVCSLLDLEQLAARLRARMAAATETAARS